MCKKTITYLAFMLITSLYSQEKDLKVGLVLSGGGAKGFAHIGVLQVLEQAGVRIDYIGGTSMGSIIGAIYASGYNVAEIDSIIKSLDIKEMILDKTPRNSKTFHDKERGKKYLVSIPVKKFKLQFPKAISKGKSVLHFLTKTLESVDHIYDFKKLPIPFFCIGTDLETGKAKVFEEGNLSLAIRASGSLPALLTPIEIDGKMYIDGGVANNFPTDIMKEKGVDIIIGVDVQGKLHTRGEINSVFDVLSQITYYKTYENKEERINMADVYIRPIIDSLSVTDFDKIEEIIALGREAALPLLDTLRKIARLQKGRKPHIKKRIKNSILITEFTIEGNKKYTNNYIEGILNIKINDEISYSKLYNKINNLDATGNFSRIQYTTSNCGQGKRLSLSLEEEPINSILKAGIHYDKLYKTSILLNYTYKNLLFHNDILSLDVIAGDNLRYNLDYFVDNGLFLSYGFYVKTHRFESNYKSYIGSIDKFRDVRANYNDLTSRGYLQWVLNRRFALGIGVEYNYLKVSNHSYPNDETINTNSYIDAIAYLKIDTYDDKYFPMRGFLFENTIKLYLESFEYENSYQKTSSFRSTIGIAGNFRKKVSIKNQIDLGIVFGGKEKTGILGFFIGGYGENFIDGMIPFYGYNFNVLENTSFAKVLTNINYEIFKGNYISLYSNFLYTNNVLGEKTSDDIHNDNILSGYAAGYTVKTPIGPIEIKRSWSPDSKLKHWYFNIGFWF
ncbi:MAG: patatin-like phospholipase family protein [Flavobacteriaceae bacterium]|nr:patatin-like phospholipase family protein [Flavobacteriaceae bacterium]